MENSNALDPTGLTDSYPALQEMADSDYPMDIPPGYFYISQPVIISRPKIITMSQPLLQPFSTDPMFSYDRKPGPNIKQSHTRIWTDKNINFFEIRSPQVFFEGGCLDAQNVAGWDKAGFYYPAISKDSNGRVDGWGGGANNFLVIGSYLDMILNKKQGGFGVYFDFENYTQFGAYWTHMSFIGKVYGVRCGWFSSPRKTQYGHWANTVDIDLEANYSKQSIANNGFDDLRIKSRHQARHVFATREEAESKASIFSRYKIFLEDNTFFDFADEQSSFYGGCWKNSKTVELYGDKAGNDTGRG